MLIGSKSCALAGAAALVLLFAPFASARQAKEAPPAKSVRVAVLPLVNESGDFGAPKILEDVLKGQFKEFDPKRATFLMPPDVERILEAHNALDRAYAITERWAKSGTLDSTAVGGLDSLLQVDAILCVKVNEWENHIVNQIGAGESSTTIALAFTLFDIKSMKKAWHKEPREQRFAKEIDASSGAVNYDETGVIQTRSVISPPRYQDVAADLVRTAFKKFPQK